MSKMEIISNLATAWANLNPTLTANQIGLETDTGRSKVGPGAWNSLTYSNDWSKITGRPAVIAAGADAAAARTAIDAASQAERVASELCARMTVRPTRARRALIESLIASMMTSGVWAKLDGLYLFAAHDVQAAKLNWVGCAQDITAVNAPTFQIDRGFTGDGVASYLDTNTPANTLEKYAANDATLGTYARASFSGTNQVDVSAGTTAYLNPHQSGNVIIRGNVSGGSAISISNGGSGAGLTAWSRDASNLTAYRAGSSLGSSAIASGSLAAINVRFLVLATANFSTRQLQMGFVGQGLSATEHANLNTALVTYLTAIGAN